MESKVYIAAEDALERQAVDSSGDPKFVHPILQDCVDLVADTSTSVPSHSSPSCNGAIDLTGGNGGRPRPTLSVTWAAGDRGHFRACSKASFFFGLLDWDAGAHHLSHAHCGDGIEHVGDGALHPASENAGQGATIAIRLRSPQSEPRPDAFSAATPTKLPNDGGCRRAECFDRSSLQPTLVVAKSATLRCDHEFKKQAGEQVVLPAPENRRLWGRDNSFSLRGNPVTAITLVNSTPILQGLSFDRPGLFPCWQCSDGEARSDESEGNATTRKEYARGGGCKDEFPHPGRVENRGGQERAINSFFPDQFEPVALALDLELQITVRATLCVLLPLSPRRQCAVGLGGLTGIAVDEGLQTKPTQFLVGRRLREIEPSGTLLVLDGVEAEEKTEPFVERVAGVVQCCPDLSRGHVQPAPQRHDAAGFPMPSDHRSVTAQEIEANRVDANGECAEVSGGFHPSRVELPARGLCVEADPLVLTTNLCSDALALLGRRERREVVRLGVLSSASERVDHGEVIGSWNDRLAEHHFKLPCDELVLHELVLRGDGLSGLGVNDAVDNMHVLGAISLGVYDHDTHGAGADPVLGLDQFECPLEHTAVVLGWRHLEVDQVALGARVGPREASLQSDRKVEIMRNTAREVPSHGNRSIGVLAGQVGSVPTCTDEFGDRDHGVLVTPSRRRSVFNVSVYEACIEDSEAWADGVGPLTFITLATWFSREPCRPSSPRIVLNSSPFATGPVVRATSISAPTASQTSDRTNSLRVTPLALATASTRSTASGCILNPTSTGEVLLFMIFLQPADGRSGRVSARVVAQEVLLLAQNSSVPAEPVKLEVTGHSTTTAEKCAQSILNLISTISHYGDGVFDLCIIAQIKLEAWIQHQHQIQHQIQHCLGRGGHHANAPDAMAFNRPARRAAI